MIDCLSEVDLESGVGKEVEWCDEVDRLMWVEG